ncbi:MAG: hypothetical protein SF069_00455 [Phycisphaerae bacterium]|nr:hypothetical protein [Phycisphaerae bacterium]
MKTWIVSMSLAGLAIGLTGCPQRQPVESGIVTVRVVNNSSFDVDPSIEFGTSNNSLEALDTGTLAPGEAANFEIDCNDVLRLTSTEATQIQPATDFVLDALPIFRLNTDYACDELVEFEFVGSGNSFDVVVTANGEQIF